MKDSAMRFIHSWFVGKKFFLLLAISSFGLVGVAMVLQYGFDILPCPLCILQRLFFCAVGAMALLGYFWGHFISSKWLGSGVALFALGGLWFSGNQVWLELFVTSNQTSCPMPYGPFINSIIISLGGVASCNEKIYSFLFLSLAEWALLSFLALLMAGIAIVRGLHLSKTSLSE